MRRIVIVDDDRDSRSLLTFWLKDCYQIMEFGGAAEALRWLALGASCDLILSDIAMPEIDGLEFLRRLRHELKLDLPVIAISAHVRPTPALAAGFDDYLAKPTDLHRLLETVRKYLKNEMRSC